MTMMSAKAYCSRPSVNCPRQTEIHWPSWFYIYRSEYAVLLCFNSGNYNICICIILNYVCVTEILLTVTKITFRGFAVVSFSSLFNSHNGKICFWHVFNISVLSGYLKVLRLKWPSRIFLVCLDLQWLDTPLLTLSLSRSWVKQESRPRYVLHHFIRLLFNFIDMKVDLSCLYIYGK